MLNQAFAAGRSGSSIAARAPRPRGPAPQGAGPVDAESDVLTQYLWTAIGKLAADDFRPEMLFSRGDEEAALFAKQANTAFGWGWDEEWRGDEKLLDLLQTSPCSAPGDPLPLRPLEGEPDRRRPARRRQADPRPEEARAHVADRSSTASRSTSGRSAKAPSSWELLTPWNLLPPPGVERAEDFPWEIIVRPVHIDELKAAYGDRANGVEGDSIEAMSLLGMKDLPTQNASGVTTESPAKLEDHALVYTGTQRPTADFPKGLKIVWAGDEGHCSTWRRSSTTRSSRTGRAPASPISTTGP
jgi:hypothetical protein